VIGSGKIEGGTGLLKKIMITVKTYPVISTKYSELVCTAGYDFEEKRLIRIFSIKYRDLPFDKQFRKYDILQVRVVKATKDYRIDSYHLEDIKDTGKIIGHITTDNRTWKTRRKLLNPLKSTLCKLMKDHENDNRNTPSLGFIKPIDPSFSFEKGAEDWDSKQKMMITQANMFEDNRKRALRKVPFVFKYKFRCEDPDCRGHTLTITDWEVYAQYLHRLDETKNEEKALEKTQYMFGNKLVSETDLHFFVGTVYPKNSWIIIGVFYPKIKYLQSLGHKSAGLFD